MFESLSLSVYPTVAVSPLLLAPWPQIAPGGTEPGASRAGASAPRSIGSNRPEGSSSGWN